jgi:flagellar biosynthesis GTPase FlhF
MSEEEKKEEIIEKENVWGKIFKISFFIFLFAIIAYLAFTNPSCNCSNVKKEFFGDDEGRPLHTIGYYVHENDSLKQLVSSLNRDLKDCKKKSRVDTLYVGVDSHDKKVSTPKEKPKTTTKKKEQKKKDISPKKNTVKKKDLKQKPKTKVKENLIAKKSEKKQPVITKKQEKKSEKQNVKTKKSPEPKQLILVKKKDDQKTQIAKKVEKKKESQFQKSSGCEYPMPQ